MARRIRFIPPGSLVEVSCRTVQGRFLLRPSPLLRDIVLGVLGRAQARFQVEIHAFTFLSNHYHLLLTARDALQLAGFMGFVNSNLAREAGRVYEWRERFWGRRYQAMVVSDEESAQIARLKYVLAQGCKEGLVRRPAEWPGAHTAEALANGTDLEGWWFDRTREYIASRSGKLFGAYEFASLQGVSLTPLPCWRMLDGEERKARVQGLLLSIEAERASETAATGREPLGSRHVERQHPHSQAMPLRRTPSPPFHANSKTMRKSFLLAYRDFLAAFRSAAERLKRSGNAVDFPPGSFPPALGWVPEPDPAPA